MQRQDLKERVCLKDDALNLPIDIYKSRSVFVFSYLKNNSTDSEGNCA